VPWLHRALSHVATLLIKHDADSTVTAMRTFVTSSVTIHRIDFARYVCVVDKEISQAWTCGG
jgi:hypothetical protein